MSKDLRQKDKAWTVPTNDGGGYSWEAAHMAVLMDLRDELAEIRRRLYPLTCHNFIAIPRTLNQIRLNTNRRKPKRKAAAK